MEPKPVELIYFDDECKSPGPITPDWLESIGGVAVDGGYEIPSGRYGSVVKLRRNGKRWAIVQRTMQVSMSSRAELVEALNCLRCEHYAVNTESREWWKFQHKSNHFGYTLACASPGDTVVVEADDFEKQQAWVAYIEEQFARKFNEARDGNCVRLTRAY